MKYPRLRPLTVLGLLTVLVLLVHLALLQGSPLGLGLSQPQPPLPSFSTRLVPLAPVAPAAVPARPAPAVARRVAAAAPATLAPEPVPETVPVPAEEATAPAAEPVAEATPPAASPPPLSAPHSVPGSARLKYKVETNKFAPNAGVELLWQQDSKVYEAQLAFTVFSMTRVQTSRGEITPQGLAPIRFSDKFHGEVAAHFNRDSNKITFSANTPDVPLMAGAQDQLSVMLQMAALIAGNPPRFTPATTLAFQTVGPRNAGIWVFTVIGEEVLPLPGGQQVALKLLRQRRQEVDQRMELWLAPALGYLPARIRLTDPNGDFVDQQWLATEALQAPAATNP